MKKMHLIFSFFLFVLIFLSACNKFDAPPAVWDPNTPYPTGSAITSVVPSNTAPAGVREITVIGQNFSRNSDSIWVYFGAQQVTIKSISAPASVDTIVFYRPPNYGLYNISVVTPAADSIARYLYTIENPVSSSDISGITGTYLVMEADKNDTMWIASTGANLSSLYKLSPNGLTLTMYKDTSYLKPRIGTVNQAFRNNFADMKYGPGKFLYATFNTVNSIYCMYPDSNTPKIYATLAANNTAKFDFDDNGNLYTGKSTGLFLVKPNPVPRTGTLVGDYTGSITFGEIRVIKDANNNKYVYALVGPTSGVQTYTSLYRSPINSDGTVGAKVLVYSIAADTAVTGCTISSFNIKSDGTILLSLVTSGASNASNQNYSVYVLEKNGSVTPYYKDIILPTGVDQLIWGNSRYLYLSRGKTSGVANTRFYRMGLEQNGAPYLGRNL